MKRNLENNIKYLQVIRIATWFQVLMPIVLLFFKAHHLELSDIMILQAVYSISTLVLEIPTGYIADIIGRRKTLILGFLISAVAYIIFSFSFNFFGFLIAELIFGLGESFISGTDSAMLYDTLLSQEKQNEYVKHEGKLTSFGNFSEAIGGILGGMLILISIRLPLYVEALIYFVAVPFAFLLVEPPRHNNTKFKTVKEIVKVFKQTWVRKSRLNVFLWFSSIVGAATLTMAWLVQPYLLKIEIPQAAFGIIWTSLNLTAGFFSFFAHKFVKNLSKTIIISCLTICILISYFGLSILQNGIGILIFFFFYSIRGIGTPVLKEFINIETTSDIRATVLSIRNFTIRILFSIIALFIGFMPHLSTQRVYLIVGFIFGSLFLFSLLRMVSLKFKNPNSK